MGETICQPHICKELIFKIYKTLLHLNSSKTVWFKNGPKHGQRNWIDCYQKKTYKWTWKDVQCYWYQGNADQIHEEIPSYNCWNGCHQKGETAKASEDVERGEPLYTAASVGWHSYCGKLEVSSKIENRATVGSGSPSSLFVSRGD